MERKEILIHCSLDILKKSIEKHLSHISEEIKIEYTDFNVSGNLKRCYQKSCKLIVIIPAEPEEDYLLCLKLKLFLNNIPIVYISSFIPESYRNFLDKIHVDAILELPHNEELIEHTIRRFLS